MKHSLCQVFSRAETASNPTARPQAAQTEALEAFGNGADERRDFLSAAERRPAAVEGDADGERLAGASC